MARVTSFRSEMVVLVTALWAVYPVFSEGAVIVNLNNAGSETLHEISVNPGEDFQIDLRFGTSGGCGLISMYFTASTAFALDVVDGVWQSPWSGSVPVGGVDPVSATFGGGIPLGTPGAGPILATMQIGVDANAAPGTYTLNVDGIVGASSVISQDYIVGEGGPDFLVRVVPEPNALLFAGFIVGLVTRQSH